jgi:hypothetical protein
MAIKYTNFSQVPPKFSQITIFGSKICHLATLLRMRVQIKVSKKWSALPQTIIGVRRHHRRLEEYPRGSTVYLPSFLCENTLLRSASHQLTHVGNFVFLNENALITYQENNLSKKFIPRYKIAYPGVSQLIQV